MPQEEHHLPVPRTARYVTFGAADGPAEQVWFALHGYGQLAHRFARALTPLGDGRRLVVVPEGLSRFYVRGGERTVGASWMTREDRETEIADYVRYLDLLLERVVPATSGPADVHVLGFSQGTSTACRWVALGVVTPRRLVLWGGEIPPDLDWERAEPRFRALDEVLLVAGERDEFITPRVLDAHAALLAQHGIRHRIARFDGGHEVNEEAVRELL